VEAESRYVQTWEKDDGSIELRNYGFTYSVDLDLDGERDVVTPEGLQRSVDQYPYWLSLARAVAADPLHTRPTRTLKRDGWKPAQPGRSPAFLEQIADEYVRRFDDGENSVTAIALVHGVEPGTVSKWLTRTHDPRVTERRKRRYRRRSG
jgi:hypothetical protein